MIDDGMILALSVVQSERDTAESKLSALREAVLPVLTACRNGGGYVSEEQITKAWDAYDA